MDWDQLRIFLAATRAGSLRGASEQLGVNHATVNRAIRALEATLNTRLFDRSAEGLSLTQSGEALVAPAEEMERQAYQITRRISGRDADPTGTIRLSISPSLAHGFLAPILRSFTSAYPDINVHVAATNRRADLNRHEADISVRVADAVDDDVVGRRVLKFVQCVYASPGYLARHGDLTVGDGAGAHWINFRGSEKWIKSSAFPNAKPRHYLPEVTMQIEACAEGLGLVYVPCFLADRDKRIIRVPGVEVSPGYSIWLLLHRDLRQSARVRAFVDHTARYMADNRALYVK